MTARISIETALDDSKFRAFQAVFERFSETLAHQASAWGQLAEQTGESGKLFADAAEHTGVLAEDLAAMVGHARGFESSSARASGHWARLARDTRSAAGHIKDATESLLRWAGITALVGGVAGAASPFLLAPAVGAARSTALGSNASYGGLQSFRVNYARVGDGDSFLSRVADAQTEAGAKRLPFTALGVDVSAGRDSAEVGVEFLRRFKDWVDKVPPDLLANRLQASRMDGLVSVEEARRLKAMGPDEAAKFFGNLERDRKSLDVDPAVQKQWQDLSTQLTRAGTQIESTFVTRLVALEPGLEYLSSAFSNLATKLLQRDGPFSRWLGKLDEGVEWLAGEVDKPEFQKTVSDLFDWVGRAAAALASLGGKVVELARWMGVDQASAAEAPAPPAAPVGGSYLSGPVPAASTGRAHANAFSSGHAAPSAGRAHIGSWWTDDRVQHAYDRLVADGMSPRGAEAAVARFSAVESGRDGPDSVNGTGHRGIAQWDRERWAQVPGAKTFDDQLDHYAYEADHYRAGLPGAIFKNATTDYQAALGASVLERAEGYDPSSGRDNYTGATAAAIPRVHEIVKRPRGTTVTLRKNTGGNPVQTAAAAAAPP